MLISRRNILLLAKLYYSIGLGGMGNTSELEPSELNPSELEPM
jgi:hypothetical protein